MQKIQPELIFCHAGNARMVEIAISYGFSYGARLPDTVYYPPTFIDQDWEKAKKELEYRPKYMGLLEKWKPKAASVVDWEYPEQLSVVLDWAEEAADYVTESVIIIPKVIGGIPQLPRQINGKRVILGYSVPSNYAGTPVPAWEFFGWPVHLLGGSPHRQINLWYHLQTNAEVISLDNNMIASMAVGFCQFWMPGTARYASNRFWPTLSEARSGERWDKSDAYLEAFRRSCENMVRVWRSFQSDFFISPNPPAV